MDKISSTWNSIDGLGSVNFWAQVILAAFVLGTFFFTAVSLVATFRKESLQRAEDLVKAEEIANTRKLAADANERAGLANERAARLEVEAERAQLEVEKERLARVKIEESVAWRRLTREQQDKLASRLSSFPGQVVSLVYNVNDVEAFQFATDIASALQRAKWKVTEPLGILQMREGPVPFGTNPPLEMGVTVMSTGDRASRDASDLVVHELVSLGFDSTKSSRIEPRSNPVVFLTIEHRPNGAQGAAKLRVTGTQ